MEKAQTLLRLLGITNCTQRHLTIVEDFLNSGSSDAKVLLDQLGSWDDLDLAVVEEFLRQHQS